ncbi:MAG: hypothetical protein K2X11_18295 [Acetobacteraceae bacterium]|nr:hypothetical protein [Acetobacteraceae bacterium]
MRRRAIPPLGLALLLLGPAAIAQPAGTRADDPLICLANSSGYVARFTLDWQPIPGEWRRVDRRNLTAGVEVCHRVWNTAYAVRVRVEGHTGFEWRDTCEERFARGESGKVTATGTSLHQRCRRT